MKPYIVGLGEVLWDVLPEGKQLGGAMVSDKHCNFILNVHKATALEYLTLIEEIQREVKNKYDIDLKMEVEKFNWK